MILNDSWVNYFLIADKTILDSQDQLVDCMVDLIAIYYVYNIEYPKPLNATLLFIQHFILGLEDNQKIPPSLIRLLSSLS